MMIARNGCRLGLTLLCLICGGGSRSLNGQDTSTVAVQVTAVFDESVYLDKGWVHGVSEGDVVRIEVEPGRKIAAKVRSVSSEDARCVPLEGIADIQVGMVGQVEIHPPPSTETPEPSDAKLPSELRGAEIAQVGFEQNRTHPGAIERRQARVTATSGGSVYLNIGRDAGLRPGDEVTFFPPNDGIVNGTVQSISATSSRCTILSTQNSVDIGTRAEVLLPTDRMSLEQERSGSRAEIPEHPPWTATPENWDENQPLLAAPAYARSAEERDVEFHGRLFAGYLHTLNQYDQQNQYSLGRIGTSMWMENPFHRGGGLHVDGELNRRGAFLDDQPDDIYGPGRLDRLSYYWGGSETRPFRFELGRFISSEFPDFGVLDGTEMVYRTAAGHRIGASVGLLPQPFPNLAWIGDLHVAAFYRWVHDPEETLSSAVGFQKTWHRGTPDRDLLIWSTDYDPNVYLSMHGTVWIDFYDSRDTLKTTDAEVTQAIFQPIFRINPRHGFGANVSTIRWPQLLRRDYLPFVDQQIIRDNVFRWGLFTWHDLGERTRIDGRVDQWRDQSHQTGTSWEGRIAFRDWLYDHGEVAFAVFTTQGLYSSGPGGRVSLNRSFPWCFASLWYGFANNRLNQQSNGMGLSNDLGVLLQHTVRANLDFTLSSNRSVSVYTDYQVSHSQDAISAGIFLQKRF